MPTLCARYANLARRSVPHTCNLLGRGPAKASADVCKGQRAVEIWECPSRSETTCNSAHLPEAGTGVSQAMKTDGRQTSLLGEGLKCRVAYSARSGRPASRVTTNPASLHAGPQATRSMPCVSWHRRSVATPHQRCPHSRTPYLCAPREIPCQRQAPRLQGAMTCGMNVSTGTRPRPRSPIP